MNRYEQRRERLRALMHRQNIDALLIFSPANRFYLSGFELHDPQYNESAGCLLVQQNGHDWLCTDSRYIDAAKRLWDAEHIFMYATNPLDMLGAFVKKTVHGTLGFEAKCVSVEHWDIFCQHMDENMCVKADGLVEQLRVIKDKDEIIHMRAACALNHQLMNALPEQLVVGASECEIAWIIERFFRENGASELAFGSIVARNANAALPHYLPAEDVRLTREDCLLVDVGCRMQDYCSDQTRTFWFGDNPTPRFRETLEIVQEAQQAGIAAIHPGVECREVYSAAFAVFEHYGVADAFTHGLGHGIGLETHEAPSLNRHSITKLAPGMIVTVEPGLYYPEWGGIRWEYMVLVTEDGAEII